MFPGRPASRRLLSFLLYPVAVQIARACPKKPGGALRGRGADTIMGVRAGGILLLAGLAWRRLRRAPELCLLFAVLYELGAGLWEFLASAGLAILFDFRRFLAAGCTEAAAGPWLVRLGAAVGAVWLLRPLGCCTWLSGLPAGR